ncbi:MAG: DUF5667 domain-containing protein, partial [Anaerolineae bacterium]
TGVMKLGTALLALVLVVGLTFGASQAAAGSLPGEPLYGLKLAVEETRLALTSDLEAQAALNLVLAEERLDEVTALLEQGQPVGAETTARVEQQLQAAFDAAPAHMLEGLAVAIQQRQRTMEQLAGDAPDEPLQQLIREMERVRQEAHAGQGDPQGEQQRLRQGTPADPTVMPPGADHTPGPAGPKATDQPGPGPAGPQPTDQPGTGPGPNPSYTPEPAGPQPTDQPGPGPTQSPSPGGGDAPGEPHPSQQPGHGNGGGGQGQP